MTATVTPEQSLEWDEFAVDEPIGEREFDDSVEQFRKTSEFIDQNRPRDGDDETTLHPQLRIQAEIRSVIDELWRAHEEDLQNVDRERVLEKAISHFEEKSAEYLEHLARSELKRRLEKLIGFRIIFGILSNLSGEEQQELREASEIETLFS